MSRRFRYLQRQQGCPRPLALDSPWGMVKLATIARQMEQFKMSHALTYKEAAEVTGLAERTLRNYVSRKQIPFYKIGKAVRFSPEKLMDWLEARAVPELSKSLAGKEC